VTAADEDVNWYTSILQCFEMLRNVGEQCVVRVGSIEALSLQQLSACAG
jgi:hypothetical protein